MANHPTLTWTPRLKNGLHTDTEDIDDPDFNIRGLADITTGRLFQAFRDVVIPKLRNEENWRAWRCHLRHMEQNRDTKAPLTPGERTNIRRILNENDPVFVVHAGQIADSLGGHVPNCRDRVVVDNKINLKLEEVAGQDQNDERAVEILLTGIAFHEIAHLILVRVREENGQTGSGRLTPRIDLFRNPLPPRIPIFEGGYRAEYILFDGIPTIDDKHLKRDKHTGNLPPWTNFMFYVELEHSGKWISPHIKPEYFQQMLAAQTPQVRKEWWDMENLSDNDKKSLQIEQNAMDRADRATSRTTGSGRRPPVQGAGGPS